MGPESTKRRRKGIDLEVEGKIIDLAMRGFTAGQIHRFLDNDQRFRGRVPSLRTVERRVREYAPPPPGEAWRLWDSDPDEVGVGLDLAAAARALGVQRWPTRAEVQRAALIHAARPDLPMLDIWTILQNFRLRHPDSADMPTEPIELYLAIAPWRSAEAAAAFAPHAAGLVGMLWIGDLPPGVIWPPREENADE